MRDENEKSTEMSDNKLAYLVYESAMSRLERANKRCFITIIFLIILLAATNIGWAIYESQFEDYQIEQEVDTGEGDAQVIGVGDIYGESKADR